MDGMKSVPPAVAGGFERWLEHFSLELGTMVREAFDAGRAEGMAQVFRDVEAAGPPDLSAEREESYNRGFKIGHMAGLKVNHAEAAEWVGTLQSEAMELRISLAEAATHRTELEELVQEQARALRSALDWFEHLKGRINYYDGTQAVNLQNDIAQMQVTLRKQRAAPIDGATAPCPPATAGGTDSGATPPAALSCATEAREAFEWIATRYLTGLRFVPPADAAEIIEELTRRFQSQWADGYGHGLKGGGTGTPFVTPPTVTCADMPLVAPGGYAEGFEAGHQRGKEAGHAELLPLLRDAMDLIGRLKAATGIYLPFTDEERKDFDRLMGVLETYLPPSSPSPDAPMPARGRTSARFTCGRCGQSMSV